MKGLQSAAKVSELRRRILFTLGMLAVYRCGVQIPTPGINGDALSSFFNKNASTIFGMFNMFSGGALENFSIFSLGIMPYISASIIIQLMTVVVPKLESLSKEGENGRRIITQYTRYFTVILSVIQGYIISIGLEQMYGPSNEVIVIIPGFNFRLITMITLTSGTAFIMWIGEQISERGIGNGISLIIFSGIVARMPIAILNTIKMLISGEMTLLFMPFLILLIICVIFFILYFETAQRRIPIQYAKRVVGRKIFGGQNTHLPLKINIAGVIPPIFASSIMMFPATIGNFVQLDWVQKISSLLLPGTFLYYLFYVCFIVFFCFFYTAIVFNPVDVAENLKKHGGFIPGIRPGSKTREFLDNSLLKLTVIGSIYVSVVCVMPTILVSKFNIPFYFGGTALLIVVGVALDTISQFESYLIMRNYDGFIRSSKLKG